MKRRQKSSAARHDSGMRESIPEFSERFPSSRARDESCDQPSDGSEESFEQVMRFETHQNVQMVADVGEAMDLCARALCFSLNQFLNYEAPSSRQHAERAFSFLGTHRKKQGTFAVEWPMKLSAALFAAMLMAPRTVSFAVFEKVSLFWFSHRQCFYDAYEASSTDVAMFILNSF
jgi:hypothetical protein